MKSLIVMILFLCLFYSLITWGLDGEEHLPADLVFVNEAEPATIDPATMTGVPEGRICELMYEGLFEYEPKLYTPQLALAEDYKSADYIHETSKAEKIWFYKEESGKKWQVFVDDRSEVRRIQEENGTLKYEAIEGLPSLYRLEIQEDQKRAKLLYLERADKIETLSESVLPTLGEQFWFKIRSAQWSNEDFIYAQDFQYSFMRIALADTASQYGFLINNDIEGAAFFNSLVQTDLGELLLQSSQTLKKRLKDFSCTLWEETPTTLIKIPFIPFDPKNHPQNPLENNSILRLEPQAVLEVLNFLLEEASKTPHFPIQMTTMVTTKDRLLPSQLPTECAFADGSSFRNWRRPGAEKKYTKLYEENPCYQTKEIGWPLRILKIPRTLDLNNKQKEWIYEKLAPFGIQFLWKPDEVELRIPVADPYDYFMKVGVEPLNSTELRLTLNKKVPYILDILAFHTLRPVHRETMELFPDTWMKPQNCVSSGAFRLKEWKIQNRMEFEKNPYYWDRHNVKLNRITALPIEDMNTAFSLYEVGLVHIITEVPTTIIPWLTENRSDFHCNPYLGIYFYRCNVTEKPLSNKNFRKALNLAIDKEDIVKHVSKAGERAALSFVPPGFPGYTPAPGPSFNPEEARKYLKLAKEELKDPLDQPIPILYNTNENHKAIAERIQSLWQEHLGLKVELVNKEWKVYLDDQNYLKYKISRSAWIGDYNDPNTFLDLFVTNGTQNRTGWSNKRYDELILELAALEGNPEKRMAYFNEAEQILMEELPIFPLYFYVTKDMVHPRVRNFHPNIRNLIAFKYLSMQEEE